MKAWDEAWQTEAGRRDWLEPHPFVLAAIPGLKAQEATTVLDLGFGVGRHAIRLAAEGFAVHGLEASAAGLHYAEQWAQREGLKVNFQIGAMTRMPYAPESFDAVLAWNVIYHGTADTIGMTLLEVVRVLRPGGAFLATLISTRNEHYGHGDEIEPDTFVIPGSGEKSHPHHYFDRVAIDNFFRDFELQACEEAVGPRPGGDHWQIHARKCVV